MSVTEARIKADTEEAARKAGEEAEMRAAMTNIWLVLTMMTMMSMALMLVSLMMLVDEIAR